MDEADQAFAQLPAELKEISDFSFSLHACQIGRDVFRDTRLEVGYSLCILSS